MRKDLTPRPNAPEHLVSQSMELISTKKLCAIMKHVFWQ